MVSSYVGENQEFERQYLSGELEVDLVPQGTLAERMRAGGAGIPAFFTPAGAGTLVAEGKETRVFDGKEYVLEEASSATSPSSPPGRQTGSATSSIADSARNFNPMAATAGRVCIAEVEELVEPGELDPELVQTPALYVDRIVVAPREKRIERRTIRKG
jgi:3-oxoacid CoA-transferase subunit A